MSLWVLLNERSNQVINDLQIMCPDPGLAIDPASGRIAFNQTQSSPGGNLINALVRHACYIGIRGEPAAWSYRPAAGKTLQDAGGVAVHDRYPGTTTVEVVYDTTDCNGTGQWIQDATGTKYKEPTHVVLFHELAHALHMCTGTFNPADPEPAAITDENNYRAWLGLPLRAGHGGGCGPAPLGSKPPTGGTGATGGTGSKGGTGCFIATAAYGSEMEPEVEFLRRFRDDILRKTRSGEKFFDAYWGHYYRISPLIVELMRQDAQVKDLVRWSLVNPIVQYLQLAVRFPDAPIEGVEEPWRSFLLEMREGLEDWAKAVDLPFDFRGLSPRDSAEEIAMIMRYILRTENTRKAYLRRLEELGQLPLQTGAEERADITERLRSSGRSEGEIARILGTDVKSIGNGADSFQIVQARGTDHVVQQPDLDPTEWFYTVTVANRTTDTFDQIVVFYKRVNLEGVVFLQEVGVTPGQVVVFRLGACNRMENYVVGFFLGDDLVAKIPGSGNMTPQLASQLNPTDVEPCADSWSIA